MTTRAVAQRATLALYVMYRTKGNLPVLRVTSTPHGVITPALRPRRATPSLTNPTRQRKNP